MSPVLSRRRVLVISVLLALIALGIGCDAPSSSPPSVGGAPTSPAPPVPPAPPGSPRPTATPGSSGAWAEHVSQEGRFKAFFPPGTIQDRTEQTNTPNGPVTRRGSWVRLEGYGNFYVWYTKLSAVPPQPDDHCRYVAENATKAIATSMGGEVLSNVERPVGNHKARQCKVTIKQGPMEAVQHILYVVDRDYLYQVQVVGPPGTPPDADVEKFFASFSILE